MNEIILHFVQNQKAATICCIDERGNPYCFSCFFSFNGEKGLLYFKSSSASYHVLLMIKNPVIAGTILPDKLNALAIKGIQFEGFVLPCEHLLTKESSKYYHRKFPFALAISGEVYTIQLTGIKMTDGSKGFGKKITWKRNEPDAEQEIGKMG